jgi:hypothetical protein
VILKAIKKRENMGDLMPMLPLGKKLGELEGKESWEGEGNTSTRHLTLGFSDEGGDDVAVS